MTWIIVDDELSEEAERQIFTAFDSAGPVRSLTRDGIPVRPIEHVKVLWKEGETWSTFAPRSGGEDGFAARGRSKDRYKDFRIFEAPVQEYELTGYLVIVTAEGNVHHYGRELLEDERRPDSFYNKMLALARQALTERRDR